MVKINNVTRILNDGERNHLGKSGFTQAEVSVYDSIYWRLESIGLRPFATSEFYYMVYHPLRDVRDDSY